MRIAIVVCAYTLLRWGDIVAGIAEAQRQLEESGRPGEVVLVVDHSPEVYEKARAQLVHPSLTILENTRTRGLSGARNTGVTSVSADVYVFLDDDALPMPGGWTGCSRRSTTGPHHHGRRRDTAWPTAAARRCCPRLTAPGGSTG